MKDLNVCLECGALIERKEYCLLCARHMVGYDGLGNKIVEKEVFMNFKTKAEKKVFVEAWWKENGHLVDDLVDLDTPFMEIKAIEQFYMEIGLYEGKRSSSGMKGSREMDNEDTGLRMVYDKAGYVEYECERCGEVYPYEPKFCTVKDDRYGISCGCEDFMVNHGPFEGVYILNQEAILCGDFQSLPRNSHFEDGANFNDVALIDDSGIFYGYGAEADSDTLVPSIANSELEAFRSRVEYRNNQRAEVKEYRNRLERHVARKLKGLSYQEALNVIFKFLGGYDKASKEFVPGVLQYGVIYYFSDYGLHYKYGTMYAKELVYSKDGSVIKRNRLEWKALLNRLVYKWAKLNNKVIRNKAEQSSPSEYEVAWNKFMELYNNMPDNLVDKLDIISSGKLDMTQEDVGKVIAHSIHRVYRQKKSGLPRPVYVELQKYQARKGA